MDDFICQILVGSFNKKIEFLKKLFIENDVMFYKKSQISVGLIKNMYKAVAEYNKDYSSLNENLKKIAEVRNMMAHGCTVIPDNIDFIKFKIAIDHKKEKLHLTEEQLREHLQLIASVKFVFIAHFNWKRLQ